ncbi:hypothetical protein [Parendozoicomonas sp. Alg238-R29]|uniref:hypothetical protein n=1 Tax=Parendozoicomonas sp. Alg238-R29 TaxID=2993446 RepID=UPI00248E56B0|nr:hypothetical protein [Parendozoicomonas sp. Alg238-R29]
MSPVTFIYGPMKSGKTARLIGDFYALSEDHPVVVVRSAIDTRSPDDKVKSRNGQELPCFVFDSADGMAVYVNEKKPEYVLVDEAHFLSEETIMRLVRLSLTGVSVRFYGLMTDYRGAIFSASQIITRYAQQLDQIFARCTCGNPAQFTRFTGESNGRTIIVGHDEHYFPVCTECFLEAQQ